MFLFLLTNFIYHVEFTGDLSLALDTKPVSESPSLSDSLDITAEPAAVPAQVQHPLLADSQPLEAAGTGTLSDQPLAGINLDLSKASSAKGTSLLR